MIFPSRWEERAEAGSKHGEAGKAHLAGRSPPPDAHHLVSHTFRAAASLPHAAHRQLLALQSHFTSVCWAWHCSRCSMNSTQPAG